MSWHMRARVLCTSSMLKVDGSMAVNDYHGHGAKFELPMRANPLPIHLLLAMVGAALEAQKSANRDVAFDQFARSLWNQ